MSGGDLRKGTIWHACIIKCKEGQRVQVGTSLPFQYSNVNNCETSHKIEWFLRLDLAKSEFFGQGTKEKVRSLKDSIFRFWQKF